MGPAKLCRNDFRHGFLRCHVPWEPSSAFTLSEEQGWNVYHDKGADAASDSGVWGGRGKERESTTNYSRLLHNFVRSPQVLAEKHLQPAPGKGCAIGETLNVVQNFYHSRE